LGWIKIKVKGSAKRKGNTKAAGQVLAGWFGWGFLVL
jgi:hypothetical protein